MKKIIFFLVSLLVMNACSSRKKKSDSTFMKGFSTYYNTLFNSKDALESELETRTQSFKDNYYAPYIPLLKYDEQPLGSDIENSGMFSDSNASALSAPGRTNVLEKKGSTTTLQISEAKALKAISKYSVIKNGEEKNKKMFDSYLLLAQSRLYMNKPLDALDALNNIFTYMRKDKRLPLAKIYQGEAFAKMGDYYRADEIFRSLKDQDIKKEYRKLLSVYYSEMLLNSGKKEAAVSELEEAFSLNKNRELRSRISYLRGQILSELGKKEEARESFATAYKYSNDFEFEVKSQIEIAKTFNAATDDYNGAKQYLEKISKKGTYASRKNEFYYALGLMAKNAGKKKEADSLFRMSLKEPVSDPQIRGLDYYEIGKSYFDKSDYLPAGAYYDSAIASMTYAPTKALLKEQTENIKKVSTNYYLIKKNDSILALTKLSDSEKIAFFNKYIEKLKAKEAQEELERKRAERNKGFDDGDYSANSIFAGSNNRGFQDFSGSETKGGFYFANANTVTKGQANFKQIWGNRALADNWRSSSRNSSIDDLKNEALGLSTAPDPRRHDPSFYIEKIPKDSRTIEQLKKDRDTASLGLGRMYEAFFSDTPLATKTLYDLVDAKPEEDIKLQALYQIFAMNYVNNPSAAERAKQMILSEFPYTSYAEFVKNPKNNSFSQSSEEVIDLYTKAFNLYEEEKFDESKALIESALEKYPKDALVPKFALLNAFNTGKTVGKEIMILQLEQIALNYAKTPEGEKAKDMLKYLKSDLKIDMTDDKGNKIKNDTDQKREEESRKAPVPKLSGPGNPPREDANPATMNNTTSLPSNSAGESDLRTKRERR